MEDNFRMKFLTVQIRCKNHQARDNYEKKQAQLLWQRVFPISYTGNLNVDFFTKEVRKIAPKNILCKNCKSNKHNLLSYSFTHTEIL